MIDFVKVELPREVGAAWAKHPALDFQTPVSLKTGECAPRSEARYRQLMFTTYPSGRATLAGSLHQLRHGQHNGGDFPAWAVAATIDELAYSFRFRPNQAELRTIEFGLNIALPAPATDLLRRAVLYKTLPFSLALFGGRGYYLEAAAQQYSLKLYDKQRHLLAKHRLRLAALLRVELRVRRMEWLSKAGIVTLADLTQPAKLAVLGELLAEALSQVLFAVGTVPAGLAKAEQRLLTEGRHPAYWQTLNEERPASLRKSRQRYRELATHHAPDQLALAAAEGLAAGWERLLTAAPSLPHLVSPAPPIFPVLTNCRTALARAVLPGFNSLTIGVEPGASTGAGWQPTRRCRTCGRDISAQAPGSWYCSEARYGKEAKRCRNAGSNPRHNTRRAVVRLAQQPCLFDLLPHLRLAAGIREFATSNIKWAVQQGA